jgi:UDP-glucose 4-epimerase
VVRRYLGTDVAEISIFIRDEKKQDDMRERLKNTSVKFCLGDVRGGFCVPRGGFEAGSVVRVFPN